MFRCGGSGVDADVGLNPGAGPNPGPNPGPIPQPTQPPAPQNPVSPVMPARPQGFPVADGVEVPGRDAQQGVAPGAPLNLPAYDEYNRWLRKADELGADLNAKRGGADSEAGKMWDRDQEFPESVKGTPEFYKHLAEHYTKEFGEAPDYLMNYGDKYAREFAKLESELSPQGKEWARNTMRILQDKMMEEVKKDPSIVQDPERFRDMAFETHSDAYIKGGLRNVPNGDLLKIMQLPDIKEWMDWRTWKEAGEVGPYVIGPFLRRILENSQIGSPSIE